MSSPAPASRASATSSSMRSCPACQRATTHVLRFAVNGCEIVQCDTCGLGRAEATGFNPVDYYTRDYFSGGHSDGYPDYRGAEPVLRREFARSVEFIRNYRSQGKLLEIGCAYGFFLQEAKRFFNVTGIELAAEAAAHCRSTGLDVRQGVANEVALRQIGPVDVIVLFDVIEHLPHPFETLALCARYLNPGGVLVLTTGDFASPVARLAGAKWRLMTPPQHLWFFTPESLRRVSGGLGLVNEHLDHPWKIVPASLILFQLRRMFRLGGGAPESVSRVGIPVNLFDAMRLVLRKAEH